MVIDYCLKCGSQLTENSTDGIYHLSKNEIIL